MIDAPQRSGFKLDSGVSALVRLLGADAKPSKVEQLPNGRVFYFDIPVERLPLARRMGNAQARMYAKFIAKVLGGYPSNLLNPQMGGVGDSGVPTRSQIVVFQVVLTPASVATIVCAEQALTVTGILLSDILIHASNSVNLATAVAATVAHVSAADTIRVDYCNPTAGALVPTPGTHNVVVLRG